MAKLSKGQIGLIVGCSVLVLFLGAASVWTYGIFKAHWDTPVVRGIASFTRFPAARVGSHFVLYSDYLNHLDAERRFLKGDNAKAQGLPSIPDVDMQKQTLERVMRISAVEDYAKANNFSVTPADLDSAFLSLVRQGGASSTVAELDAFVRDEFGWDESQFKQNVLRPALLEDGLKTKLAKESPSSTPFGDVLDARLQAPDAVRYLKF